VRRKYSRKFISFLLVFLLLLGGFAGFAITNASDDIPIEILEITDSGASDIKSKLPASSYHVTTMSMKKFVAWREELDGKYDVIYIGRGTYSTAKVPLTNDSNRVAMHDTKNRMNDITKLKAEEIVRDFVKKGQPVILHSDIYKQAGSNLNQYFSTANIQAFSNAKIVSSPQEAVTQLEKISSEIKKPLLQLATNIEDYSTSATIYQPGQEVSFEYTIPNFDSLPVKDLVVNLYIDTDFNKKYEPFEVVATAPVTKKSGKITYFLPRGYSGIRFWKFEIVNKNGDLKDYESGTFRFRDQKVNIKVLQVTKSSNDVSSLLKTNNMSQNLHTEDYDINIDVMDIGTFNKDGYKKLNGTYDMLIFGLADVYNSTNLSQGAAQAVQQFIDTKQSVMFTHDTIFNQNNIWVNNFKDDTGQTGDYTNIGYGAPLPSTSTKKVNEGIMNLFPYKLGDVTIAKTHNQYYVLNLEDESVIPWYNITGGTRDTDDSWNHYYTYSKGNVTYSGTGHTNQNFPDSEQKLFVNTMYRAFLGANHAPELTVYTPKDKSKIRTTDKLQIVYRIEDFDLKDRYVKTKIWANNELVYQNDNVANGMVISQSYDKVWPEGTTYKVKIEATDNNGASTAKEFEVTVDKVNSDLSPNRVLDKEVVVKNTDATVTYTMTPAPIPEEKMPPAQASQATGVRPLGMLLQQYEVNKEYPIVSSDKKEETFYKALALGGRGKSDYRSNLENGYSGTISTNQKVDTEPGEVDHTTFSILSQLIDNNNKVITIPLVDSFGGNGRDQVTVQGFATFELKKKTSSGKTEIVGIFKGMGALPNTKVVNVTFNELFPPNLEVTVPNNQGVTVTGATRDGAGYYTLTAQLPDIEYVKKGNVYEAKPYTFSLKVKPLQDGVYTLDNSNLQYTDLDNKTATAAFNTLVLRAETPVTGVELNKETTTLKKGSNEKLIATVLPEDATNKAVTWVSSDPNVVQVDDNGVITALNYGTAVITVTTVDGNFTASCKVTVIGVELDKHQMWLEVGATDKLNATVFPADAPNKSLIWNSSDESVATVDQSGVITGIKPGIVTITVTTVDGGAQDVCEVTVGKKVKSISLNDVVIDRGETQKLEPIFDPPDATNKNVTWQSSDPAFVSVDGNGYVTGLVEGKTATITVTTVDGNKTATAKVTVRQRVTGVELNKHRIELNVGETEKLIATVLPDSATNKAVSWESSNPLVATVDSTGLVRGLASGTAVITVTTEDGGFTDTCEVIVKNPLLVIDENNLIDIINKPTVSKGNRAVKLEIGYRFKEGVSEEVRKRIKVNASKGLVIENKTTGKKLEQQLPSPPHVLWLKTKDGKTNTYEVSAKVSIEFLDAIKVGEEIKPAGYIIELPSVNSTFKVEAKESLQ
jgi:uncharacterized protein YjdB